MFSVWNFSFKEIHRMFRVSRDFAKKITRYSRIESRVQAIALLLMGLVSTEWTGWIKIKRRPG